LPQHTERRIIALRFNRRWGPHQIAWRLGIPRSTVGRQPYASEAEREAAYADWLHHYNHHRPHTALAGSTPAERVHNLTGNYS